MTTSPQTLWKSVTSLDDHSLEPTTLGYFHGLAQDEAHELVLSLFQSLSKEQGITRAFIARRLDKSPEQVTRWLSAPGNWTLDTFTNLLLAMGYKPKFDYMKLSDMRQSNNHHPAVAKIPTSKFSVNTQPENTSKYTISTEIKEDRTSRMHSVLYQI